MNYAVVKKIQGIRIKIIILVFSSIGAKSY